MKKIVELLIAISFTIICKMVAQTNNKKISSAEDFFLHSQFSSAQPLYADLLARDSSDVYLNLKMGICYLKARSQKAKAVAYLRKAISPEGRLNLGYVKIIDAIPGNEINILCGLEDKEKGFTKEIVQLTAYNFLGDAYYFIYEFDRAIECYEKYKNALMRESGNKVEIEELNKKIGLCLFGKNLDQLYTPVVCYKEENIFKPGVAFFMLCSGYPFAAGSDKQTVKDVFIEQSATAVDNTAKENNHKKCLNKPKENSFKGNEATIGTSENGQMVLIYRVNHSGDGNLYMMRLINNQWTNPERLDKTINDSGWEPGEFITPDGSAMYFVSDKPGGYGGKDIYKCKKLPDGGWGMDTNLGPVINTPYDEDAPFIYPDGSTLYFRSDNVSKTSGCYDIFMSSKADTGWTEPVTVGYPIDIIQEDTTVTNSLRTIASKAISSNEMENPNNNYVAAFFNLTKTPLTLIKRQIVNSEGRALEDVKIIVTDNEGKVLSTYYSNQGKGQYLFILPDKAVFIHYEAKGYFFQSEFISIDKLKSTYETFKPVRMLPVEKGSTLVLNTIFFTSQDTLVQPVSCFELDRLVCLLADNSGVSAQVLGYVNETDDCRYNRKLAYDYTQALMNYLINRGINKDRITIRGYGKLKSGSKNEEYQNMQLNQRFEIKIRDFNIKKV